MISQTFLFILSNHWMIYCFEMKIESLEKVMGAGTAEGFL